MFNTFTFNSSLRKYFTLNDQLLLAREKDSDELVLRTRANAKMNDLLLLNSPREAHTHTFLGFRLP